MDIEKTWQQSGDTDNNLEKILRGGKFGQLPSRHPMKKLQDNLLYGIVLALLITIGYAYLFVKFSPWQIRLALVVVTLYNLVIIADSLRLYRVTREAGGMNHSLREELQNVYDQFLRWWRIQLRTSLFVFPFAVTGGFILGGIEGSGKTVEAFLYRPLVVGVLAVTLAVLIPACYYLSKWMFRFSYGRYLKQIKASLDELS